MYTTKYVQDSIYFGVDPYHIAGWAALDVFLILETRLGAYGRFGDTLRHEGQGTPKPAVNTKTGFEYKKLIKSC